MRTIDPAADLPTLADLRRDGLHLRIWCNRCGRRGERDAVSLCQEFGETTPIYGLWVRFWCSACGASGRDRGDIYTMPESAPLGPMGASRAGFEPMIL